MIIQMRIRCMHKKEAKNFQKKVLRNNATVRVVPRDVEVYNQYSANVK